MVLAEEGYRQNTGERAGTAQREQGRGGGGGGGTTTIKGRKITGKEEEPSRVKLWRFQGMKLNCFSGLGQLSENETDRKCRLDVSNDLTASTETVR